MHTIIDGDGLLYQAAYNVPNVRKAYDKLVDKVDQLCTQDWDQTGEFTMFIEGKGNWRKDVFPEYKAPRKTAKSEDPNKQLRWDLAEYLIEQKLAIPAIGCESDDLVRRKAENMFKRNQPYIVASADKDLDMVCGHHIRFNTKWQLETYEITKKKSDWNYFFQLMVGDGIDNIKSPRMLGKAKAERLLKDNPSSDWKKVVENEYKTRCGSEWFHALMFTGSLIHIQRAQDDYFVWDKKKGNWWDCGFSGPPKCYGYTDIQLGKG